MMITIDDFYTFCRYSHPVTSSRPEYIQLQPSQQRLSYDLANQVNPVVVDPGQGQPPMSRSYTSNTTYTQQQYQATSPGRRLELLSLQTLVTLAP